MAATGAESYATAYDANDRLAAETRTDASSVVTTNYSYDPNGNQCGKTSNATSNSETSQYNGFNQLVCTTIGPDMVN